MKILILGDVVGPSGRKALKRNLPRIIKENKINFSIVNGENAQDDGKGITKKLPRSFFIRLRCNHFEIHIWDKEKH